ncbi:MAG: slipin family protein [Deltaproteobacteria bacterium]|nr:slipin family protein [Deltaproteobacteria bacterium]
MAWSKSFQVGLEERGVLFEDGTPTRVLKPGLHKFSGWSDVDVKLFPMGAPLGDPPAALVALFGTDVTTVDVGAEERGVLLERGVAVRRLAPGRHVLWTHKAPTVEKHSVKNAEANLSALSPAVRALLAEDLVIFDVTQEERVVLLEDNIAVRVLPPGRHGFWKVKSVGVARYDTKTVVVELPPAHAPLLADDVVTVTLKKTERGIVSRSGKPFKVLGGGQHTLWKHPDISVNVIDMSGVQATPLDADIKPLVAATDYTETTVPDGAMGVRFVDGAIDTTLPPGRHAAFTIERQVSVVSVDLRERVVSVQGQDILTKDKVTLRLNASMTYRVVDVTLLVTSSKNADEILYLCVQLGLREQVAMHTLDEILSDRSVIAAQVRPAATARAKDLGLELVEFGVKDIILPGDMKLLLNKVIEAQKTAEANVILRREETAAVRSMSQTAKILAETPILMRLKELELYKDVAEKVRTLNVVVSAEGLPGLQLPGAAESKD